MRCFFSLLLFCFILQAYSQDSIMGVERNTQLFLGTNLNLICEFLFESELKYEIYYLMNYDSPNKDLYQKIIK